VKDENVLLGPPTVVTIMPTAPTLTLAGVIQVIVVSLTTLKDVAFNPPNVTTLAPVKAVPLIVTEVPPSVLPDNGKILAITGGVI
jgi:hypothetical protein